MRRTLLAVLLAMASVVMGLAPAAAGGVLPAVEGLRTTTITADRVVLNWQPVDGAIAYKIETFERRNGAFELRESTNVNGERSVWFTNRLLIAETDYRFVVSPIADGGQAGASDDIRGASAEIEATTTGFPLRAPIIGRDSRVGAFEVTVVMFERPQVDFYELFRDGELVATGFSGVTDSTVQPNTTYTYELRERIGERAGPFSQPFVVTTPADPEATPAVITFSDRSAVVIRIGPITNAMRDRGLDQIFVQVNQEDRELGPLDLPARGGYPYVWVVDRDVKPDTVYTYQVFLAGPSAATRSAILVTTTTPGSTFR